MYDVPGDWNTGHDHWARDQSVKTNFVTSGETEVVTPFSKSDES